MAPQSADANLVPSRVGVGQVASQQGPAMDTCTGTGVGANDVRSVAAVASVACGCVGGVGEEVEVLFKAAAWGGHVDARRLAELKRDLRVIHTRLSERACALCVPSVASLCRKTTVGM